MRKYVNYVKTLIKPYSIPNLKVTFMLTNTITSRRRRRGTDLTDGQQQVSTQLFNSQVYQDLAQASGGHAIEVTKETLSQAANIITVTSSSKLVNKDILWL